MTTRYPYFKWFASDMESDEWFQGLTDAEIGYYVRLMNHTWTNGSIPADSTRRCRLFHVHPKTDQAAFKNLSRMFQEDAKDASRLLHGPLQEQRKACAKKSATTAESVNHRYERKTGGKVNVGTSSESDTESETDTPKSPLAHEPPHEENTAPVGAYSLTHPGVIPISDGILARPSVRSSRNKRTVAQIKAALGEERLTWWDSFWSVYPCHQGSREGLEAFAAKVTTRDLAIEVYRGAQRYAALAAAQPDMKLKHPQGWINGERWNDECVIPKLALTVHQERNQQTLSAMKLLDQMRNSG